MSDQKEDVVRASKSSTHTQKVRLALINVSDQENFCHRDLNRYTKDENIAPLVDSLLSEGLLTPLTVAERKDGENGNPTYILIGGHRRLEAIKKINRENLDTTRFHNEMEIPVVIVQQQPNQSRQEFEDDLFFSSITDNSMRVDFTEDERIQIVKRCIEKRVSLPRAARALDIGEKQFQRIASVVSQPWLLEMVTESNLSMTHAVKLLEAVNKNPSLATRNLKTLRDFLRQWIFAKEKTLSEQIARAKKSQRPLSGSAATVKKFVTPQLLASWCECLTNGHELSERAIVEFGINVDPKEGKIVVPGIEFRIKEGDPETLKQMIFEFQKAAEDATTLFDQIKYFRSTTEVTPEEKRRKLSEIYRKCEEEEREVAKLEAGRQPTINNEELPLVPQRVLDVTDELDTASSEGEGA